MSHQRTSFRLPGLSVTVLLVATTACGSDAPGCDPTNPACGTSQVAAIAVSSPVDSVLATGSTVRLTSVTTDAGGVVVSAVVDWTSSDPAVAAVSSSGLVSAIAAGSVTMTAVSGSASEAYAMRVVDAEMAAIGPVLGDAMLTAGMSALSPGAETALEGALQRCDDALVASHVLAVEECLAEAGSVPIADGNDEALLGVLSLFFSYARQLLDLGR